MKKGKILIIAAMSFVGIVCVAGTLLLGGQKGPEITNEQQEKRVTWTGAGALMSGDKEAVKAFAAEYNQWAEQEGKDTFSGSGVEFSREVTLLPDGAGGIYIDFDGDNGYMVLSFPDEAVAFETKGDLQYIRDISLEEKVYYSIYDGFVSADDEGDFSAAGQVPLTQEIWNEHAGQGAENAKKIKNFSGGDGEITDPDGYVKNKYGNGFSVYQSNHIIGYDYVLQNDLSLYYRKVGNCLYGEGNCSLSSIYSIMNHFKNCGRYPMLPEDYDTVILRPSADKFYKKYACSGKYYIEAKKLLPKLYSQVRKIACEYHGYEVGNINPFVIEDIIEKAGKVYGADVNATHLVLWSFEGTLKKELDRGRPIIWNMATGKTYGSHTVVVTGYRTYRRQKKIFGIKISEYVKLAELNDNWNDFAVFFDFGGYSGVGSFVRVQ